MKLVRGLHNLKKSLPESVVTLGNFDGLHLGHQQLILKAREKATKLKVPLVVVTFEPQPKDFFARRPVVPRLMRLSEKYLGLKNLAVDYLCVLYFEDSLAKLSAQSFVEDILLNKLGVRAVWVGDEFRFGYKREGDFKKLEELAAKFGFEAHALPCVQCESQSVSSTRVREALQTGRMEKASKLLGHYYTLRGKVTYGDQRGREFGFPTANINLHRELVPLSGVFVVKACVEGCWYKGVANVGLRPTVSGQRVLLEVHLFEFEGSLYGLNLEVSFLHKLREEKRYDDFKLLVEQIKKDVESAKEFFKQFVLET